MSSEPIISISQLSKVYASGFQALEKLDLEIYRGEIFSLLGPNGAGKTTLISIICGIVNPSAGTVRVDGSDVVRDYRTTRSKIGLVPQELASNLFETVWNTVRFSRCLYGKPPSSPYIESLLKSLTLIEKKDNRILTLSGGMKRRVMIAKALSHEPQILFLDEPTAGVDVELRREMWEIVRELRRQGVTIILTTHYIEEAEEMADRIGILDRGKLILVEEKTKLMRKLGKKQLILQLQKPLEALPPSLSSFPIELSSDRTELTCDYDVQGDPTMMPRLLRKIGEMGIEFKDLKTKESSLEEIFVGLVKRKA